MTTSLAETHNIHEHQTKQDVEEAMSPGTALASAQDFIARAFAGRKVEI